MWATRLSVVDWVCSKTQILLEASRIQNQPPVESYISLEAEHLFAISWMSKKQTSVSHSSTESETISLDTGLRMDRLLALDLWDVVIEVLRSSNSTKSPKAKAEEGNCLRDPERDRTSKPKQKGNRDSDQLSQVDHVTTNAHSSQGESQLYIFWRQRSSHQDDEDEVQQWDTCSELTELRLICCSTALNWNRRSKSTMLTPKTNLLTFQPKWVSRVTSGTIFFVCSTSLNSQCLLAAISIIFFLIRSGSRVPC